MEEQVIRCGLENSNAQAPPMLTTTQQAQSSIKLENSSDVSIDNTHATKGVRSRTRGAGSATPVPAAAATVVESAQPQGRASSKSNRPRVDRGLTTVLSPLRLRGAKSLRALSALNRFRVIRTFDLAALCAPERPFKAALTAAQKTMRGLKKAGFVHWYRTDRQQHIYGLTKKGADLLQDHGVDATSSVRRVSDMSNPEHMLWASFIAVCCEIRGLIAFTEAELLHSLNRGKGKGDKLAQGLLNVSFLLGSREKKKLLRPDVVAYETDGATWFEIDRSKRGAEREASLGALFTRVGTKMVDGMPLRRAVVLAKTDRIMKRALAVARGKLESQERRLVDESSRVLRDLGDGHFEVVGLVRVPVGDGRSHLQETKLGHVVIQLLPTWLPKVRIAKGEEHSTEGWFSENYLPYRRPSSLGTWRRPSSPFLSPD